MKISIPVAIAFLLASCGTPSDPKLGMEPSIPAISDTVTVSTPPNNADTVAAEPAEPAVHGGEHPISLQWISWDKKGSAKLMPADSGWYLITGRQENAGGDYLSIDGKIRRVSAKELAFEGTITTRVYHNFGNEPCIKEGPQRFFAKGSRTYYRLQNMENCMRGNVVDYVDIYPGSSSL